MADTRSFEHQCAACGRVHTPPMGGVEAYRQSMVAHGGAADAGPGAMGHDQAKHPHGVAHVPRAPGALFSRETIVAIVRGKIADLTDQHGGASLALRDLCRTFENLE